VATYNLEEQEKLAELKVWWKQYGNLILVTVTLALFTVAAVRGWDAYKRSQAADASAVYSEVVKAASAKDAKKVADLSALLRDDYPRTIYAPLAAFVAAKFHVEQGDRKAAREALQWAAEHARDEQIKAIARLRLAYVLLDDKAYDEALKQLEGEHPASFGAAFAEARGDLYAVQNKRAEARAAYQEALAATPSEERALRELLQFKLDDLGEA